MTDNEIIKALDICGHLDACADCPLGCLEGVDKCMHTLLLNALDLINRQKAEIERLQSVNADMQESLRLAAEANKDMQAELGRLRKKGEEQSDV